MADLTSTVTVTGTFNGRKITFTDTCTIQDVYDTAEVDHGIDSTAAGISFSLDEIASMNQDCPSFLWAKNTMSNGVGVLTMTMDDGVNTDKALINLESNQFTILHEYTNGAGIIKVDASPQTTYFSVLGVSINSKDDVHGKATSTIITANIAST